MGNEKEMVVTFLCFARLILALQYLPQTSGGARTTWQLRIGGRVGHMVGASKELEGLG